MKRIDPPVGGILAMLSLSLALVCTSSPVIAQPGSRPITDASAHKLEQSTGSPVVPAPRTAKRAPERVPQHVPSETNYHKGSAAEIGKNVMGSGPQLLSDRTILEVRNSSGDVSTWRKSASINKPQTLTFHCGTHAPSAVSAEWQVLTSEPPAAVISTGHAGTVVPGDGYTQFSIDFSNILPKDTPASPKHYAVRIVIRDASSQQVGIGSQVALTYQLPTEDQTVGDNFRKHWLPVDAEFPMRVGLRVNRIYCLDGDGDNPFLYVAAVRADGTTIPAVLKPSLARVEVWIPSVQAHGDLLLDPGSDSMTNGKSYRIPEAISGTDFDILPVGLEAQDLLGYEEGAAGAIVGIVVVAMKHHSPFGTADSDADGGRTALRDDLQADLDSYVQSYIQKVIDAKLKGEPKPALELDKLKDQVSAEVYNTIKKTIMENPTSWLADLRYAMAYVPMAVNHDELVGTGYQSYSYAEIKAAGLSGIPFSMDFNGAGSHYQIDGWIGMDPIMPDTPDPHPNLANP